MMEALREALEDLPDSALVPVSWIRERLDEEPEDEDPLGKLYDVPTLAARFDRSEATIRSWLADGKLRGFKLEGRQWKVRASEVRAFEQRQAAKTRR